MPGRRTADDTDWRRIARCTTQLAQGCAVAGGGTQSRRGRGHGVRARRRAWRSSTRWRGDKSLRHYQWLPSVRGDLLARLGRDAEARAEFERAAALASNARERALLLERVHALRRE